MLPTPTVSWTVSAVITDNGWQPNAEQVIRSACIPAPPDGSLAEKLRTIGGDGVAWLWFIKLRCSRRSVSEEKPLAATPVIG